MLDQEDGIWEETDRINREAEITPILGFSFNTEPVANEIAAANAVVKEFKNWEYQDDYEARYDQRSEKLRSSAEVILDEWLKANGMK